MITPEARARLGIDQLLGVAGCKVQDRDQLNLGAGRGVAIREFSLATGASDYLLFVDRKALGAVEAKPVGTPLSGVEPQSAKYSTGLPPRLPCWRRPLPFLYESTGVETFFTNPLALSTSPFDWHDSSGDFPSIPPRTANSKHAFQMVTCLDPGSRVVTSSEAAGSLPLARFERSTVGNG